MKHLTIIYVLLLSSVNLLAQAIGKETPFDSKKAEGPAAINSQQNERVSKARTLVSADEVSLCLFNHLEIREAFTELKSLRNFFSSHNAESLYKLTQAEIFSDRVTGGGRDKCVPILKLYPDNIEPISQPKFSHARALRETIGEELLAQFSFCLSYIGLEYLDKEIWDVYVSREVSLIKEIKELPGASLRLKGFILAMDFRAKVCQVENGFSQQVK
jgi:hypothetical protein